MLVLTRKPRQQIMIGDDIVINVVEVQGENVRAIQEENQKAAAQVTNIDLHDALPLK